jgi:hypothetical protein
VARRVVAVKHDFVARDAARAQTRDKVISFGVGERTEDRRAGDDARDGFGVHGAERYARAFA